MQVSQNSDKATSPIRGGNPSLGCVPDAYTRLHQDFTWAVPEHFNIAQVCCTRWAGQPDATKNIAVSAYSTGAGDVFYSYFQLQEQADRLSCALQDLGVARGDRVAIVMPQCFETAVAYMAVLQMGAVAMPLSMLFGPDALEFRLHDSEAVLAICDASALQHLHAARLGCPALRTVLGVGDATATHGQADGNLARVLAHHQAVFTPVDTLADDPAILIYTSGTTGNPKGVVYHHRGAAVNAVSNILEWDMPKFATYLWTLPMFHCNGWCFPWTIAARAGVNVCLRRVEARAMIDAIKTHGVTHYCGAPIVHGMLVNAPDDMKQGLPTGVKAMVAGAAPPASMIEGMERMGFDLTHVYGLTEVYGPATVCPKHEAWDTLDIAERARLNARQGVRYHLQRSARVIDPHTMQPVPQDGETMGEIMFRGNITMKGYLKNPAATQEAFAGGWFHTGDLAVQSPDGYIKIKDRSKDIIISGGENISSIEVEDVLYRHPDVLAAAVVARPDERWGETPADIVAHCKKHLAGFKVPRAVVFGEVPKTSTGKIQKFELRKKAGSAGAIDV
jgi:fatty-acyl-CoA synthase